MFYHHDARIDHEYRECDDREHRNEIYTLDELQSRDTCDRVCPAKLFLRGVHERVHENAEKNEPCVFFHDDDDNDGAVLGPLKLIELI